MFSDIDILDTLIHLQEKAERCGMRLEVITIGTESRKFLHIFDKAFPILYYKTELIQFADCFLEGIEAQKSRINQIALTSNWRAKNSTPPECELPYLVFVPTGESMGYQCIAVTNTEGRVTCIVDAKDFTDEYTHWMHLPLNPHLPNNLQPARMTH